MTPESISHPTTGRRGRGRGPRKSGSAGFTLPELLVAMTVLAVLLLMLTELLNQVQRTWTFSENRISQFREARVGFDIITKNLSQSTLNAYYDQVDLEPPPSGLQPFARAKWTSP